MNSHIDQIRNEIEPLRQQIIHHPVYSIIEDIEDLRIFMEYHVFAVWDFMSLLKTLQTNLTCTSVPWFPTGSADTRFLINEIVVGEESDVDVNGIRKSHFEMYLDAMIQCGANTGPIDSFVNELKKSGNFNRAFDLSHTPEAARQFVEFTFRVINQEAASMQAAIFTFGREDLIPGMFISLIHDLRKSFPNNLSLFNYYLERHIEVDGDHHSHLALDMTRQLCGEDEGIWARAEVIIKEALLARIRLWDGVYNALVLKKEEGSMLSKV